MVGILTADWHLGLTLPVCRGDANWLEAQARPLRQIDALQAKYHCPVFVAGDVFHRWDAPPELISWLLRTLGRGQYFTIPGNHDIPGHDYKALKRSAYWVVVESGRFLHLPPGGTYTCGRLLVTPFPPGVEVVPPRKPSSLFLNVAMVHDYVWTAQTGRPHADPKARVTPWLARLKAYDLAVFGDNHNGFLVQHPEHRHTTVFNCGALQRRTSDQKAYRPRVGLLHSDGRVVQHYLDCSADEWGDQTEEIDALEHAHGVDLSGFVEEVSRLRAEGQDWPGFLRAYAKHRGVPPAVANLLGRYTGGVKT